MSDVKYKNVDELLADIDREWIALMETVDRLSGEQIVTADSGGWSPKDNLAHLSEWMKVLMGYHMDKRPAHEVMGVAPEVTKDWDFDAMNQVLFERNRNRSIDDVTADLRRVYKDLLAKLASTPFEDLLKPRHADDPEKRPLLNWVLGDTTEHFAEHREAIERVLKGTS